MACDYRIFAAADSDFLEVMQILGQAVLLAERARSVEIASSSWRPLLTTEYFAWTQLLIARKMLGLSGLEYPKGEFQRHFRRALKEVLGLLAFSLDQSKEFVFAQARGSDAYVEWLFSLECVSDEGVNGINSTGGF